ncbi:transcriptional regulator [Streptomyces sp. AM 2-1-1]|uniref:transcriptional regulator n=1 Tax=Streptomyces sp. AM 2-1-1 TaxID=3028709 RepID=UPI0023B8A60F|nr:transcriptional regulator [Streptomyces sp. AM 2-1-1]WEH40084.1 helix-turn-helix domain-containing protein [Streptomyces sp. AM 2-1-1]
MTEREISTADAPLPAPKERRRLREAKSLSEEQVASVVGVTPATVRSWESGRTDPRGRKRAVYARLLGCADRRDAGPPYSSKARARPPDGPPGPAPERGAPPAHRPADPAPTASPAASTASSSGSGPVSVTSSGVSSGTAPAPAPGPASAEAAAPPPSPADTGSTSMPPPEPDPVTAPSDSVPVPDDAGPAPDDSVLPPDDAGPAPDDAVPGWAPPAPEILPGQTPEAAFDSLYHRAAPGLVGQAFLLTGRRALSRESVERAFHAAWERWPEVAVDRDPAGWVRAAAHEYALSPWHRVRRVHRHPDAPPADPERRALLEALLALPPSSRRTLVLYDSVGLDLPETAAETEASTPAAAGRLMNAHAALAERLPELAAAPSYPELSALLRERLAAFATDEPPPVLPAPGAVRGGSERKAQLWTRAAIVFAALLIGATAFTLHTAPTRYEEPLSPASRVGGVPPRGGPPHLTEQDLDLLASLRQQLVDGPERLVPQVR